MKNFGRGGELKWDLVGNVELRGFLAISRGIHQPSLGCGWTGRNGGEYGYKVSFRLRSGADEMKVDPGSWGIEKKPVVERSQL